MCDIFPPAFGPRMGYLCKYLKRNGIKPVVVAEYIEDKTFEFLNENVDVSYVRFYHSSGLFGKFEWLCVFLLDYLFDYKENKFFKQALKLAAQHSPDLVLCSSYRTFPLLAASKTARKLNVPLIVDLRDVIEQYSGNEFITHALPQFFGLEKIIASMFKRKSLKIRNKVLRQADCVTTISSWHVQLLKQYNPNTHLIYNGYDPELFFPVNNQPNKFFVTYTGRVLSLQMRNPELLFRAVQRLDAEQIISPESFQIRWFTDYNSAEIIKFQLNIFPEIQKYNSFFTYIPAASVPEILNESAVILLLTNKSSENGPQGVMTTKLFEALAVQKPLLCVRGDEGCIEDVINRTQSGLSAHDETETYNFLKMQFLKWRSDGTLVKSHIDSEIKHFSRETQALQFINLFNSLWIKD